jgi:hypothetical protein
MIKRTSEARVLLQRKFVLDDGSIIEIRVVKLPSTSDERPHGLKYSLFFGRPGRRTIGYDNERGKGDHRHYGKKEERYVFETLEKLLADFAADVRRELRK